ncbi:uncharacterized protein LOC107268591 [Cephus cinctus]|uniref:Uncharacterized protein LOC107268591 n=1 Tax=Cephus cinctus TaxID=211228 RepID=A0AAJ7BYY3_CEPCN|nr:uncharacterized protein LOC107268591 [Cephus cinctus]
MSSTPRCTPDLQSLSLPLSTLNPVSSCSSGQPTTNDLLQSLISQIKKSDEKITVFITGQLQTNQEINEKLNNLNRIADTVNQNCQRISNLEQNYATLLQEIQSLKAQLSGMSDSSYTKLHEREDSELILSSVPARTTTTPVTLVSNVFQALGVPERSSHILAVRCISNKSDLPAASTRSSSPPEMSRATTAYIVTLTSVAVRDIVLTKKRNKRDLRQNEVCDGGSNRQIYINELLPASTYNLLRRSKALAKEKSYKFVWCKNNTIFVRKDNGCPPIMIQTENDLNKLV